jgi:hypothetical protein
MKASGNLRKYSALAALALAASLPLASQAAASGPTPGELAYAILPDPAYQPVDNPNASATTNMQIARRTDTVNRYTYLTW